MGQARWPAYSGAMRVTTLERAFELARTGRFSSVQDIKRALDGEGYTDARAQLEGRSLRGQLKQLISEARKPGTET